MLLMISTLLVGTYNYLTNWPKITQEYRPGTCYVSQSTEEVFEITGFRDGYLYDRPSQAIPAKILKVNNYTQHKLGEIVYLDDGDKKLKKVSCPLLGIKL